MPVCQKNLIILPKDSHITTLILQHIHYQVGHSGRNHMLSRLAQKFWLPRANSLARNIIRNCVFFRRMQARPGEQKMADLPEDHLYPDLPPCSHVGIDYFGPIEVKRGRVQVKRWGVIFTCLVSQAIHLEVSVFLIKKILTSVLKQQTLDGETINSTVWGRSHPEWQTNNYTIKWPQWFGTTNPEPFASAEVKTNYATRSFWKGWSLFQKEMETSTGSCRSLLETVDKIVSSAHARKKQVEQHKKELKYRRSGHHCG